jgi:adenylate cyclase
MSCIKNALSRGRRALGLPQPSARQVRLAAGLVLFTYVATHYVNHSIANISVAAAESGLVIQKLVWQTLPGAVILLFVTSIVCWRTIFRTLSGSASAFMPDCNRW